MSSRPLYVWTWIVVALAAGAPRFVIDGLELDVFEDGAARPTPGAIASLVLSVAGTIAGLIVTGIRLRAVGLSVCWSFGLLIPWINAAAVFSSCLRRGGFYGEFRVDNGSEPARTRTTQSGSEAQLPEASSASQSNGGAPPEATATDRDALSAGIGRAIPSHRGHAWWLSVAVALSIGVTNIVLVGAIGTAHGVLLLSIVVAGILITGFSTGFILGFHRPTSIEECASTTFTAYLVVLTGTLIVNEPVTYLHRVLDVTIWPIAGIVAWIAFLAVTPIHYIVCAPGARFALRFHRWRRMLAARQDDESSA